MKKYAKQTALALAMALTVTSVAPATASAAAKPKYSKTYSTVKKGKNYVYTVKNIKKGTKVKWTITGTGKSCVSFSKTKAVYTESTTAGKKSTHSSNRIFIRKNKSSVVKVNIKATVTGTNGKKYTVSDKIAIAKGATATTTPATETPSTAPETTATVAPSEVPGTSATPAPSEVPGTSATPTPSGAPATSETPATTATTAPSGAPATSETPAPSGAPATSATPAPTATVAPITAGASATVDNHIQFEGYDNLVLVNGNAIVTVTVRDENKQPIANKPVVFTVTDGASNPSGVNFAAKGDTVVTTDQEGRASFVVANKNTIKDATVANAVGSAKYTATIVGTNYSVSGTIGFAAVQLGTVKMTNPVTTASPATSDLNPGTNALLGFGSNAKNVGETTALGTFDSNNVYQNGDPVEYVRAQQVSVENTTSGAVTFGVTPTLKIPDLEGSSTGKAKEYIQEIDPAIQKSGKYGTYDEKTAIIPLEVPTSQLQYATLNFNSIQISKYSKLTIASYRTADATGTPVDELTYDGPREQSGFAYQIPLTDDVKAVKVTIESAGQVQTDKNSGYDIKNIKYVYKENATSVAGITLPLKSAKIDWKAVTPVFSNEMGNRTPKEQDKLQLKIGRLVAKDYDDKIATITGDDEKAQNDRNALMQEKTKRLEEEIGVRVDSNYEATLCENSASLHSFTYQVPVFPYTGNAVIKEYDKNGNIVAYYLAPTEKSNDSRSNTTDPDFNIFENPYAPYVGLSSTDSDYKYGEGKSNYTSKNTNVLDLDTGAYGLYIASKEEAEKVLLDGVTTDGNTVTVNSEKVGSTTLEGVVSIAGLGNEELDATNAKVYTSVHWNPIPNKEEEETNDTTPFLAFKGQKITVRAQVVDKNNNPVSLSGQNVSYKWNGGTITTAGVEGNSAASVISLSNTDVNGTSTLVLNSTAQNLINDLHAELSGNTNYDVKLYVENSTDTKYADYADLYWVNANLKYTADANDDSSTVQTTDEEPVQEVTNPAEPNVGTPWDYGVQTIASKKSGGYLKDYKNVITVDGLNVNMIGSEDNRGSYTFDKGTASAKSEYANRFKEKDVITATINEDSVANKNVTFILENSAGEKKKFVCVGEGTPNIDAKLKLGIEWKAVGVGVSMITPEGTRIKRTATGTSIYVRVVDGTGKNVKEGVPVTFASNNEKDTLKVVSGGSLVSVQAPTAATATTDENGVAVLNVINSNNGVNDSSIITAAVDGVDVKSATINWVTGTYAPFGLVSAKVAENSDNKAVELRFNNEVNASSVNAKEFILQAEVNGKTVTYGVKSASVNGTKVTLTLESALTANEYTVRITDCAENGIGYHLTDIEGKALQANDTVHFYTTNASFDLTKCETATGEITLKSLRSPVEINEGTTLDRFNEVFVITVDGKIVGITHVTADNQGNVTLKVNPTDVPAGKPVRVYHMGYLSTVTSR